MPQPMVVIRTYLSTLEAEIARGLLEASDIDALISSDDCSSWHPEFHTALGVRLLVPQDREAEANDVLDHRPELPDDPEEEDGS
jgi:hypothetical protein